MAKKEWKIGTATFRTPSELYRRLVELQQVNGTLQDIIRQMEADQVKWQARAEYAEKRVTDLHLHAADIRAILKVKR